MGKEMKSHQRIVIVVVLLLASMVACRIGPPEPTPEVIVATLTPVAEVPTTPPEAVLLPPAAGAIVVDNLDPGFSIEAGDWGTCEDGDCQGTPYGTDFRFADPPCTDCRAEFSLSVPAAGEYDVLTWWPWGEDRATDTPFTIEYSGGSLTINVDQVNGGNDWWWLATLAFEAGERVRVIVEGTATGFASADAVALMPTGGEAPPGEAAEIGPAEAEPEPEEPAVRAPAVQYFYTEEGSSEGCHYLHWDVSEAATVLLDGEAVDNPGSTEVCPEETTGYTLYAENGAGTAEQIVTVAIGVADAPTDTPEPIDAPVPTDTPSSDHTLAVVQLGDLQYLGAFRLPGGDVRPQTFAYGGNAMTFNPNGDASGSGDGFPGSLFVTGHDRLAYGELPDGSQVAEISIPEPVKAGNLAELNQAEFLQQFHNVAQGFFTELEEIPRIGLEYLDAPAIGAKIHLAWGQHMPPDPPIASHAWFDPNLSSPDMQGTWFIGNQSTNSVNGYLFEIPSSWADEHAEGRNLAAGRFRDGGWSGMGPALFAYRPWIDDTGTPAPPGTHLEETVLLLYESPDNIPNIERSLDSYQHPDEWEGGAWITTSTGKSAVLFAGTKGTGAKYWYGYVNPAGPEYPCVGQAFVGEFPVCRLADGTPCPSQDLTECAGHNDYRGWWSARFDAQFILYDPADLARVAAGETGSWVPQPYASLDIDEYLFLNPAGVDQDDLGTGVQRRYRISAVAYDRINDLLYVVEPFADEARPVVHVWRVQ